MRTREPIMSKHTLRLSSALLVLLLSSLAAAQSAGGVTVAEVVVARAVEDHEPVGVGTSFAASSGPLVCFVRLENRTRAEAAVYVAWEPAEGEPAPARGGVRLAVSARPRYRTYARTVVERPAGAYRCVVRGEDGQVLGSAAFTLTD